jgi:dTDP-4-dehydrorhamnose 3,5-epimerase
VGGVGSVTELSGIEGVALTPLRQISDARGSVLHMLRADDPEFTRFGECYFSEIVPGAVKAWKRHKHQTQLLAVPTGRITLVLYDDREESPTRGRHSITELGRPDAYVRVRIPPGIWYGFRCLGDTPALIANCPDQPHDPGESEQVAIDQLPIPFAWRIE